MRASILALFLAFCQINAIEINSDCLYGRINPDICCQGVPTTQDVLLRNPADCHTYYQCVHEEPLLRPCAADLHWSVTANRCEWPDKAGCQGTNSTPQTPTTSDGYPECIIGVTDPKACCKGVPTTIDLLLPNPADCETYYQCVHEEPVLRPCSRGLHWSISANSCEWPSIAGCTASNSTQEPTSQTNNPTQRPPTTPEGIPACIIGVTDPNTCCKGVPTTEDVLLPNPEDCGTYYLCVHEEPVLRPCPEGLHWSVSANRCEWPLTARCTASNSTPKSTQGPTSQTNPNATQTLPTTPEEIPTCIIGITDPNICCKGVPTTVDLLLPNPADCGTYYQCVHEEPVLRPCPRGLHWSISSNRCEWPSIAGCTASNSTQEPTSQTNNPTQRPSTTPEGNPICIIGVTDPNTCCKGVPTTEDVLLPNPEDCSTYYQCVHEQPMLRPCPEGLHWSVTANRCEWPWIAGCANDNFTPTPEPTTGQTNTKPTLPTTPEGNPTCIIGVTDPETCCKGVPPTEDVFLPNPEDCGTYYQCVHEEPVLRPCPGGLHWSVSANRCEWPPIAECIPINTQTTTQAPTTPPACSIPDPPTEECLIGITPAAECCKAVPYWRDVMLPNPEDCGSYLQCINEKPVLRPCPMGLHWSIVRNRCEWPKIAKCESGCGSGVPEVNENCLIGKVSAEECCKGVPYFLDLLLKNPADCGTYYQCIHEKPILRSCPSGLHWSVKANRCEWKDIAKCE